MIIIHKWIKYIDKEIMLKSKYVSKNAFSSLSLSLSFSSSSSLGCELISVYVFFKSM